MGESISLRECGMNNIYVVSSGMYDGNIGLTDWLALRAFVDREKAEAWIESEIKRDPSFNENFDFYKIEDLTLYE
jgi:hypothetical protein